MITVKDVTPLWDLEFNGAILAAVEDAGFHQRLEKWRSQQNQHATLILD